MRRVYFGLSSTEGDRLGHLVRGVQMLRSYGHEAEIDEYSAVVSLALRAEEPPALACVIGGRSAATLEALEGICRETEWALGKDGLAVWVLQHGDRRLPTASRAFEAIRAGRMDAGMTLALDRAEFARICDWGQQQSGPESDVAGEWPSATGP